MTTDDDDANGDGHSGHFTRRLVPAGAPVDVPAGGVSSPFAMARQFAGDRFDVGAPVAPRPPAPTPAPLPVSTAKEEGEKMDKRTGPRGPHLMTRARETLKACGPLTVEQLAEGLGVDRAKALTLCKNGAQRGYWKRQVIEGEDKLVLVGPKVAKKAGTSGLKHYLKKQGDAAIPKARKAAKKAAAAKKAPTQQVRRPKALETSLPPAPAPIALAPAPAAQAQFGLFNTGELRIEYAGQELKLPKSVTRELVAYLDKLASAMEG